MGKGVSGIGNRPNIVNQANLRALTKVQRKIAAQDFESALILNDRGRVLAKLDGDRTEVIFTPEFMQQLQGKNLLHNHPTDLPTAPSRADILGNGLTLPKTSTIVSQIGQKDVMTFNENWNRENSQKLAAQMHLPTEHYRTGGYRRDVRNDIANNKLPNMTASQFGNLSPTQIKDFIDRQVAERHVRDIQNILRNPTWQQRYGFTFESTYIPR
ncbi:MAG: hypothetical protein FWG64_12980 [Firmicutes bacterium]|nr:hypothetical protein [Bacillota bacterium]